MKVGIYTKPNQKGQIVIPKEFRKALGIDDQVLLHLVMRGNGIYLYPVVEVTGLAKSEDAYVKLLEKTQGTWGKGGRVGNKRKLELAASRRRKQAW